MVLRLFALRLMSGQTYLFSHDVQLFLDKKFPTSMANSLFAVSLIACSLIGTLFALEGIVIQYRITVNNQNKIIDKPPYPIGSGPSYRGSITDCKSSSCKSDYIWRTYAY